MVQGEGYELKEEVVLSIMVPIQTCPSRLQPTSTEDELQHNAVNHPRASENKTAAVFVPTAEMGDGATDLDRSDCEHLPHIFTALS